MELTVQPRDTNVKAKHLRRADRVPGVVYGHRVPNQAVECREQELHGVFVKAGESTIISLKVGGKTVPVLIHEISFDPVTGRYEHVDFFAPDMSKAVTANVPIRIVGEAPGVRDLGGVLVRQRETMEVRCLPNDLPHNIAVDVSSLANFHDAVTVGQVSVPAAVTVLDDPGEIIVSVQPPRKEEEEEKPAEAAKAAEGEAPAEGTGKTEGEETAKASAPSRRGLAATDEGTVHEEKRASEKKEKK